MQLFSTQPEQIQQREIKYQQEREHIKKIALQKVPGYMKGTVDGAVYAAGYIKGYNECEDKHIKSWNKINKDRYRVIRKKQELEGKINEMKEKLKYTLNKIIETVHNDRIDGYGERLVLINDFAWKCLEEIEK